MFSFTKFRRYCKVMLGLSRTADAYPPNWSRSQTFATPKSTHLLPQSSEARNTHVLRFSLVIPLLAIAGTPVTAGPIAYGICQAGCSSVIMACYPAAGAPWGAILGATAPATVVACNTAFGAYCAACAAVALTPTP